MNTIKKIVSSLFSCLMFFSISLSARNGGAIAGGLIGGALIGSAIASANRPVYVTPAPYYDGPYYGPDYYAPAPVYYEDDYYVGEGGERVRRGRGPREGEARGSRARAESSRRR